MHSSKLKLGLTNYWVRIANPQTTVRGKEMIAQARAACKDKAANGCDEDIIGDDFILDHLGRNAQDEYLKLAFPSSWSWAAGMEGSIGYKKFSYLDTGTGKKTDDERVPWSIKGYLSALPGRSLSSITAGLEYQRAFKEKDAIALCPTLLTNGFTKCLTGPDGAAATNEQILTSLEYRRQFLLSKDGFLKSLGISTQVTYDAKNDVWGIDVPVYFTPNDKGNLIGGVRFGYVSTGHDFVVGVFIGSAFSIFQ